MEGKDKPIKGAPITLEQLSDLGVAFMQRTLRSKQPPIEVRIKTPGAWMYLNGISSYSPHINRLWP